jgi:hypothetical protein
MFLWVWMARILIVNAFNCVAAETNPPPPPDVFYFPVVFHNFISPETTMFADSQTRFIA